MKAAENTSIYIPDDLYALDIPPAAFKVLTKLATYKDGFFSTIQNLCLKTNMIRKTVDRSLKTLMKLGIIFFDETERAGVIKIDWNTIKEMAEENRVEEQPSLLAGVSSRKARKRRSNIYTRHDNTVKSAVNRNVGNLSEDCGKVVGKKSETIDQNKIIGQNVQISWTKCPIANRDINRYINISFIPVDKAPKKQEQKISSEIATATHEEQKATKKSASEFKYRSQTVKTCLDGVDYIVHYDERGYVDHAEYAITPEPGVHPAETSEVRGRENRDDAISSTLVEIMTNEFNYTTSGAKKMVDKMRSYYNRNGYWEYRHGFYEERGNTNTRRIACNTSMLRNIVKTWDKSEKMQQLKITRELEALFPKPDTDSYSSRKYRY